MRIRPAVWAARSLFAVLFTLAGCATYKDDLTRAQNAVEESQHDRAISLFRRMEQDFHHLDGDDQIRYAYLRGIADYRVGYRAEARHWLAFAEAGEKLRPGALQGDWKTKLSEALAEMNEKVFDEGSMRLTNVRETSNNDVRDPNDARDARNPKSSAP